MSEDDWREQWALLVDAVELYYNKRDDEALLKMLNRESLEAIAQLCQRHQKLGNLYSKLKTHYDERGVKIDRLAEEQSRLLAENHTLRIELREARELTAQLSRSRTVTK